MYHGPSESAVLRRMYEEQLRKNEELLSEIKHLKTLMRSADALADLQRHGVLTPEDMNKEWQEHAVKWEAATACNTCNNNGFINMFEADEKVCPDCG